MIRPITLNNVPRSSGGKLIGYEFTDAEGNKGFLVMACYAGLFLPPPPPPKKESIYTAYRSGTNGKAQCPMCGYYNGNGINLVPLGLRRCGSCDKLLDIQEYW